MLKHNPERGSVRMKPKSRKYLAVVDTNVLIDIHSCHDVHDEYDKLTVQQAWDPTTNLDTDQMIFRRARARAGLLLAMHLHEQGAHTYGLHGELVRILERSAPPRDEGFPAHFTTQMVRCIRDQLFSGWTHEVPSVKGKLRSNAADRELVLFARKKNLPLISNEGLHPNGIRKSKLRARAEKEGVTVFTSAEFISGKMQEREVIQRFLQRLSTLRTDSGFSPEMREFYGLIHGYYRHVLLGETDGRLMPVHVARKPFCLAS